MEIRKLKAHEIEVKVAQVGAKGVSLLLYKTARVDMAILDEVFLPMGWQSDYREVKGNLYAGIAAKGLTGEWIWKWDCGVESREDADGNQKKGEASDAFKRAGFRWGIGRELYTAPFIFAQLATQARAGGKGWELVNRFVKFEVKSIAYDDNGDICALEIVDDKGNSVYKKGKALSSSAAREPVATKSSMATASAPQTPAPEGLKKAGAESTGGVASNPHAPVAQKDVLEGLV